MWDSQPVDQADAYGRNLLSRANLTEVEKFHLLRGISVTIVGVRVNGNVKSSKEEMAAKMLNLFKERVEIDLNIHRNGLAANLTAEMMMKRFPFAQRKLTKRMKEAIGRAEVKAAKKNVAAADPVNMSALECSDLFLAIKYETNNVYNPIWVRSLNKNGDIPSGVQLVDLIDRVREESFNAKEVKRIEYLLVSRKRTALKKVGKSTGAVDDAVSEESEEEAEEGKEEKKVHEKIVCINKL